MNRRKSVVGSLPGSYDRKAEKKHRSPFTPFKRSESSREMQIPESPPAPASDRPETSLTEEESARNPSVSQDRTVPEIVTPVPIAQLEPGTANGTSSDVHSGFATNGTNRVGGT